MSIGPLFSDHKAYIIDLPILLLPLALAQTRRIAILLCDVYASDTHTPQELAAMNDCTDILRYLDGVVSKQELDDPKKMKRQQEMAEKEAQKLIKNFKEIQKKADKKSKKKEKDIEQEIKKMEVRKKSKNKCKLFSKLYLLASARL